MLYFIFSILFPIFIYIFAIASIWYVRKSNQQESTWSTVLGVFCAVFLFMLFYIFVVSKGGGAWLIGHFFKTTLIATVLSSISYLFLPKRVIKLFSFGFFHAWFLFFIIEILNDYSAVNWVIDNI